MDDGCPTFYGKYRGTVENPVDPECLGRIQVSVPDVLGQGKLAWASPCVPYAGKGVGFFAIPPKGAGVWVEFERGDPESPIWSGCFWLPKEAPVPRGPDSVFKTVLKTDRFRLEADSNPAKPAFTIEIDVGPPAGKAVIKADRAGLTLSCAGNTITLAADGVSINKPNLQILK